MAHHSSNGEIPEAFRKMLDEIQPGPTGRFPQGKLNPVDEGETRIAIGVESGKIVMHFGKPTVWIGFDRQQALAIAQGLIEKAAAL